MNEKSTNIKNKSEISRVHESKGCHISNKNKILLTFALIFLVITMISLTKAEIVIKSVDTSPLTIKPGEVGEIKFTIQNTGSDTINDVSIAMDLTNLPIVPIESSTEKVISEILEDDTEQVTFSIKVLPDAESKTYKIPVRISYNQTKKDTIISLDVQGKPELDVSIDESKVQYVGSTGDVTIRFINTGSAEIKYLSVKLSGTSFDLLSSDTVYIGDIKPGDVETATFKIHSNSESMGLKIHSEYRDQNSKQYSADETLNLKVYSIEEAKNLGLIKASNIIYFEVIILVVLLYFVARTILRRRKKNAQR